jgi:hypothetical protein
MAGDLIYVYCISDSEPAFIRDDEPGGLNCLMMEDFYVVVKYVSANDFTEENFKRNVSDIQWLESNAREHIRVISKVMETGTVIPFKFGTIYQTNESLRKFVQDYSAALNENFKHIRGMEEWAVKIFCDRKTLMNKIDELSLESAELEKQIMASSPGKAFLLKRKKTDLVENEMDRLCKKYGQEYYDGFNDLSESVILNNLLPKEFTGREDTMILNAAFLVSKTKLADFMSNADIQKGNESNRGFFIEVTGPWPPFSFISLKEIW